MRCPFCNADDDKVVDSRSASNGSVIRRRRECVECGRRFTTYERVEETPVRVVKKDSTRQDFDREKLLTSLKRALVKRPVDDSILEGIVVDIEQWFHASGEQEITTQRLGEMVMERLRAVDPVAFIRFASVYRDFQNVNEFVDTIHAIEGHLPNASGAPAGRQ